MHGWLYADYVKDSPTYSPCKRISIANICIRVEGYVCLTGEAICYMCLSISADLERLAESAHKIAHAVIVAHDTSLRPLCYQLLGLPQSWMCRARKRILAKETLITLAGIVPPT